MTTVKKLFPVLSLIAVMAWPASGFTQDSTTPEGLELIDGRYRALYWRPGESLDRFSRIAMLDCFVQFEEDWLDDTNRGRLTNSQVTEADVAIIKDRLADLFRESFTDIVSGNEGYEFVSVAGPDVLILRPAIVNVSLGPDNFLPRNASPENAVLEMTLYLEFFDSATGTLIGRALDNRSEQMSSPATARRVTNHWAELTRTTLEEGPVR